MPRAANAPSGKKRQVHPKFEDPRPTFASLARLEQEGARGTGVICGGACWGEHALRSGLTNNDAGASRNAPGRLELITVRLGGSGRNGAESTAKPFALVNAPGRRPACLPRRGSDLPRPNGD